MISRAKRALAWRLRAVTSRLELLADRVAHVEHRLDALDSRLAHTNALIKGLADLLTPMPERVAEIHSALDERVSPALRAILDEESENRRRLHRLRAEPSYEAAFDDPEPLVSIALATVGRIEPLRERALPSLLAQRHSNLEVVIVGDAAPPELEQLVRSIGDPRLRYSNLPQRITAHPDPRRHWLVGSTMARNEATRRARGQWILHFDDDDHLRPDAVSSLLAAARERRAEVAYGGYEEHHPDGKERIAIGFPPALGCFSWQGALMHSGLRFFERELIAAALELPGDMYLLERMLRAGVRFAAREEIVLDYFPSTLWEPARSD